jgi:hypothetical protein
VASAFERKIRLEIGRQRHRRIQRVAIDVIRAAVAETRAHAAHDAACAIRVGSLAVSEGWSRSSFKRFMELPSFRTAAAHRSAARASRRPTDAGWMAAAARVAIRQSL